MPLLACVALCCDSEKKGSGDWPEPEIFNIVTDYDGKAVAGRAVTVYGINFSPTVSDNKILYGIGLDTASIDVFDASENHLIFIAPEISGDQLKIRVSVKGKESAMVTLMYAAPEDVEDDSESSEESGEKEEETEEEPPVDLSAMMSKATVVKVREGVEWISFHGTWEGQVRNINIVKTTLNQNNRLGIYYDYKYEPDGYNVDDKCEFLDALVGTNGPMACCHFVRVDGVVKRGANEQDHPWTANAALTIDGGIPDIVKVRDNFAAAALKSENVGTGGPLLVYDGKIQEYDSKDAFLTSTHPRTALGITKDQKTVIQVAVDGRWTSEDVSKRAIGMPVSLLAKLMKGLGCDKALNFDGGGGTAMWIYEKGKSGIVNHPCDGDDWDNPVLRPAGCAVYIVSDLK